MKKRNDGSEKNEKQEFIDKFTGQIIEKLVDGFFNRYDADQDSDSDDDDDDSCECCENHVCEDEDEEEKDDGNSHDDFKEHMRKAFDEFEKGFSKKMSEEPFIQQWTNFYKWAFGDKNGDLNKLFSIEHPDLPPIQTIDHPFANRDKNIGLIIFQAAHRYFEYKNKTTLKI